MERAFLNSELNRIAFQRLLMEKNKHKSTYKKKVSALGMPFVFGGD